MAAAIGLARAGVSCEIVEITTDWEPAGVGIALQSPPLRACKELGLFDELIRVGRVQPTVTIHTADGQLVVELPQMNVNDPDDPPLINMSRIALHEVMAQALEREGVPVRLGTTIDTWREVDGGVEATLSDGTTATYGLIVGADGIHSKVRPAALPDAPKAQLAGQAIWRLGCRCPEGLERYTIMVAGPHRIGLVPLPGDDLYLWMLDSTLGPQRPRRDELVGLFQERMAAYGGFAPQVAEQVTDPEQLDFRALQWLLVPPPWHSGRVVLIGDAVHTTTPHLAFGAGLAIEDAVVLAELVGAGLEGDELGERFAARRIDRARVVVENSLQLSRWEQQGGPPHPDTAKLTGQAWAKLVEPI
jgi:2-polyprenyl-6-methoxyphenol hydroxylase-like FAD-dependent oxidoreductase